MKKNLLVIQLAFLCVAAINAQEEEKKENLGTTVSGVLAKHVRLKTYAHILYQQAENEEVESKFAPQRVIFIANGILTDELDYVFMYDFGMNPMMHEIWLRYKFSDAFEVTAGQQKVPFSVENLISPSSLECIQFSMPTTYMIGMGRNTDVINADKSNAGRDVGIQVAGKLFPRNDYHLLDYKLGLFNGSGVNVADNNNRKDFAAWALFYPMKQWGVGASCYIGKGRYQAVGTDFAADYTRNRYCVSTELDLSKVYFRAEGMFGKDGQFDRDGFYVTGLYRVFPEKLDLMLRYDYYNNHENKSDIEISESDRQLSWMKERAYTVGLNYTIYKLNRLQLHYTFKDRLLSGHENQNLFLAQLQIGL